MYLTHTVCKQIVLINPSVPFYKNNCDGLIKVMKFGYSLSGLLSTTPHKLSCWYSIIK